jgi:hypothetical protein
MEHGTTVSDPAFDEYAEMFPSTARDIFCRYPPRPTRFSKRKVLRSALYWTINRLIAVLVRMGLADNKTLRVIRLDWEQVLDLDTPAFRKASANSRLLVLQGWLFLGDKNLEKHADSVRRFFQPNPRYRLAAERTVAAVRSSSELLIGVHIRRGDYSDFLEGKYFYELDTYQDFMQQTEALFPESKVAFLVCSNESLEASLFPSAKVAFGPGDFLEDLCCLSQCDYLIGPPSTYSLWASFYGGVPLAVIEQPGSVIALKDFSVAMSQSGFPEVATLIKEDR